MDKVKIMLATKEHFEQIWDIFSQVIKFEDTYVYSSNTTKEQCKNLWCSDSVQTYVALLDDVVVGTYIMKPNFLDLGNHVANCSYMVKPDLQGQGIGKLMGNHSIKTAKQQAFLSMQFNIVVSPNERAVKLWQSLGFEVIGVSPKAFRHKNLGLVDTYVMHRSLE